MNRRLFFKAALGTCLYPLATKHRTCVGMGVEITVRLKRTSTAVDKLSRISKQRREALKTNAENKTPDELNETILEIDAIEVVNNFPDTKPRNTLRLLAWNMERGRFLQDGSRLIREHPALKNPDIIFLGEMDLGMARSGNKHTTREMAASLNMNYAYGVEFLELTKGEAGERKQYPGENEWGYHGNAILSRYPLHNVRIVRFPGIEKWYNHYQNRLGGRMALFATVNLFDTEVTLITTHLESDWKDFGIRKSQMKMILEELDATSLNGPVLLGGDLNAHPVEPLFADIKRAGFSVDGCNQMDKPTMQQIVDERAVLHGSHIDYLCVKDVKVIKDDTSPRVVPAVYPPVKTGKMLGDHALVTAKVRL